MCVCLGGDTVKLSNIEISAHSQRQKKFIFDVVDTAFVHGLLGMATSDQALVPCHCIVCHLSLWIFVCECFFFRFWSNKFLNAWI